MRASIRAAVAGLLIGGPVFSFASGFSAAGSACFATPQEVERYVFSRYATTVGPGGAISGPTSSLLQCGDGGGCWGVTVFTATVLPPSHPDCQDEYGNTCEVGWMPNTVYIESCEYKAGLEYWSPILAAFFLALVSLFCGRLVYRMFQRETY